jgi:hypothetical protein
LAGGKRRTANEAGDPPHEYLLPRTVDPNSGIHVRPYSHLDGRKYRDRTGFDILHTAESVGFRLFHVSLGLGLARIHDPTVYALYVTDESGYSAMADAQAHE